jgi:hypothetical protein
MTNDDRRSANQAEQEAGVAATGATAEGDRPAKDGAAVELVAARDAADKAAKADKDARRAAGEAAQNARLAASQAARAEKLAKSLGDRRPRRSSVWTRLFRRSSTDDLGEPEIVTFSDLVRAHRAWEQELYAYEDQGRKPKEAIEKDFQLKWRRFEAKYGQIDDAFWSVRDASAVALTIRHRRRWLPGAEKIPRFHRATDWATRDEPEIAAALDECETLAVQVEEILRGASELIALRRINAVASHLLGFVDRARYRQPAPSPGQPAPNGVDRKPTAVHRKACLEFVDRQRVELERVKTFYRRTGDGQARILYFWGMALGLIALAVLTGFAVFVTWPVDGLDGGGTHWGEVQLFVISVMSGAFGAVLSVLSRMASLSTDKFNLDHELGRKNVRWRGIYRPFVGGIFGMATFFLLASGILQTQSPGVDRDFAYYGILALFSGFFERFTKLEPGGVPIPLEEDKRDKADEAP